LEKKKIAEKRDCFLEKPNGVGTTRGIRSRGEEKGKKYEETGERYARERGMQSR